MIYDKVLLKSYETALGHKNLTAVLSEMPNLYNSAFFEDIMDYHDTVDSYGNDYIKDIFKKKIVLSDGFYKTMLDNGIIEFDESLNIVYIRDGGVIDYIMSEDFSDIIMSLSEVESIMQKEAVDFAVSGKRKYLSKINDKYLCVIPKDDFVFDKNYLASLFLGLFIPKDMSKKKDVMRSIKDAKQKKYDITGLESITSDTTYMSSSGDGIFRFSDKQLLDIEKMERSQGFDFDTSILKRVMDLSYFTPYQLYILQNWSNFDDFYLTATRRAGKSYFFTYLAIRQLMKKNETIIYMTPTEDAFEQPMMYVHRFLSEIRRFDKNIKIKEGGEVFNKETNSVLWFKSAASRFGIRSKEATFGIIDEASFVPVDEANSLVTMLEQVRSMRDMRASKEIQDAISFLDSTTGKLMCGTTINPKMPKNWYFDAVRDAEGGNNNEALSIRVGIYQCPFYTSSRREKLIDKLKHNPDKLKCELLAEFPATAEKYSLDLITIKDDIYNSTEEVIDSASGITLRMFPNKQGKKIFDEEETGMVSLDTHYVYCSIGYDPAKKSSNSAVVISEVYIPKNGEEVGFDNSKIVPIGELTIPKNLSFTIQTDALVELYKYLSALYGGKDNIIFGIDSTGIGEVVSEMVRNKGIKHYKVQYVSAGAAHAMNTAKQAEAQKFYYNSNGIFYTKKPFLMDIPISMASMNRFKTYRLPHLYSDLEAFNDINEFNAEKSTIDFYHAMCISMFASILANPEVYFYNQDTHDRSLMKKASTSLEKHLYHLEKLGFSIVGNEKPKHSMDRYKKFGY